MSTTEMQVLPPDKNPPKLKRIMSLRDLWEVFVGTKAGLSPYTKFHYNVMGNLFCTFMDGRELEPMAMVEFVNSQVAAGKTGNNRINESNVKVKAFLKWLKKMHYTNYDLHDAIPKLPGEPRKAAQIFTEEDYQAIKDYCADKEWTQPFLWLVILGYHTGMSLVDCCHLRWKDVHLSETGPSFIDIYRIKTKRLGGKALCQIPIIPFTDVHEWLLKLKKVPDPTIWHERWLKHYDGDVNFVHKDCPGLYTYPFPKMNAQFDKILRGAGVAYNSAEKKTFRHLRNTFCSNLVNSGTQMALICKMTGHNNVTTLLKYLKADRESMEDGLNKAFQFAKEGNTKP